MRRSRARYFCCGDGAQGHVVNNATCVDARMFREAAVVEVTARAIPIGWTVVALFFPEIIGVIAALVLMRRVADPARAIEDDDDSGDNLPQVSADEPEPDFTDYMYVITFPCHDEPKHPEKRAKQAKDMRAVVKKLHDAQLHVKMFLSRDKREVRAIVGGEDGGGVSVRGCRWCARSGRRGCASSLRQTG